jgi:peptide/nickel transport system substrate-binding protein
MVFTLLLFVVLGMLIWLAMLFFAFTKSVPTGGGVYTEGIVGEPRQINPILSQVTEVDADLVQMVYSGLFSYDEAGKIRKNLVDQYDLVEDGKKYVMRLRQDVKWHDGQGLSADDVVFTFRTIQDPSYKSPLRANWQGVEVSKEDDFTVVFSLKKPYFDFLENLTVGILPKHIWEGIASEKFALAEVNLNPIGSGPFRVEGFKKDSNGTFLSYELRAFPLYFEGAPFIQKIIFYFYKSEDELLAAYNRREILGMSNVTPEKASLVSEKKDAHVLELTQPRVFAVFLNEKKNVALADERVRKALALATNREEIIRDVLNGRAEAAYSMFSSGMSAYSNAGEAYAFRPEEAVRMLEEAGWKKNSEGIFEKDGTRIEFEIAVPNWVELVKTAHLLENEWKEVGVRASVRVLENISDAQRTIRSREYAALLYGLAMTFEPDPYSFWHSSQTGEMENNFAMFSDKRADELLSNARETLDENARSGMYRELQEILANKMPAVFLYSPRYLSVRHSDVQGFSVRAINTPASRFQDASRWYMNTKRVRK